MRTRLDGPPGKEMALNTHTGGRKMAAVLFASLVFLALLICSLMVSRASVASTLPSGPVGWGSSWYRDDYGLATTMPAGLGDAKDIAAGSGFSLALKQDGTG